MSTTTKILVAVDDPKSSDGTLQSLVTQFAPGDAEVRVLHVVEPLTNAVSPQMATGYAPELEARLKMHRCWLSGLLTRYAPRVLRLRRRSKKATSGK